MIVHRSPFPAIKNTLLIQFDVMFLAKSPVATLGTKHLLNYSRDHSTRDGLEYTALWSASALQAQDVTDSIRAGLTKNKSLRFKPLGKL